MYNWQWTGAVFYIVKMPPAIGMTRAEHTIYLLLTRAFAYYIYPITSGFAGVAVGFAIATAYGVVLHSAHAVGFWLSFADLFVAGRRRGKQRYYYKEGRKPFV